MFVVLMIGPPRVGKTSTLTALHDLLADLDVRHATVEVEALAWTHPPLRDELTFSHLAGIRDSFAAAGYDLILCGATVTSEAYMSGVLGSLRPREQLVVRLDAAEPTLRGRIRRREPPEWSGLANLILASEKIAVASRELRNVDLLFSTDELNPHEIATQVGEALLSAIAAAT